MGKIIIPPNVKLIMAVTFVNENLITKVKNILEKKFGKIDSESRVYNFTHTAYYEKEMGSNLRKFFISFKKLIRPEKLAEIKIFTNNLEDKFAKNNKRQVNIDPGYIADAKLILATTKNYDHRIYLKKGIYGDVHLRFREGTFKPNDWTYADYRESFIINFFNEVRENYLGQLRKKYLSEV
jgi:hypothetical protein